MSDLPEPSREKMARKTPSLCQPEPEVDKAPSRIIQEVSVFNWIMIRFSDGTATWLWNGPEAKARLEKIRALHKSMGWR